MIKRVPWRVFDAVCIFWSTGWLVFSLIFLLRDIHTGQGTYLIVGQAIILALWTWIAFCEIWHWNRPGGRRCFPFVKRRNRDE